MALPILGVAVLPFLWKALTAEGTGAKLDILGAVLVAGTAAGMVLILQAPSTGVLVALVGALLLILGAPLVALRVRHRPHGFLPLAVIRNPAVVRSALAAAAVPAAWFALLIAVPAVLVGTAGSPGRSASRWSRPPWSRCSCPATPARCWSGSVRLRRWPSPA